VVPICEPNRISARPEFEQTGDGLPVRTTCHLVESVQQQKTAAIQLIAEKGSP
jgi:hypothetical protein